MSVTVEDIITADYLCNMQWTFHGDWHDFNFVKRVVTKFNILPNDLDFYKHYMIKIMVLYHQQA